MGEDFRYALLCIVLLSVRVSARRDDSWGASEGSGQTGRSRSRFGAGTAWGGHPPAFSVCGEGGDTPKFWVHSVIFRVDCQSAVGCQPAYLPETANANLWRADIRPWGYPQILGSKRNFPGGLPIRCWLPPCLLAGNGQRKLAAGGYRLPQLNYPPGCTLASAVLGLWGRGGCGVVR